MQLRTPQWLAYEIHGRVLRKPPGKERRGPARCKDYRAWIRTLPCRACRIEGCSEAAHVGTDGGMSMKATDYSCVPLSPTSIRWRLKPVIELARAHLSERMACASPQKLSG